MRMNAYPRMLMAVVAMFAAVACNNEIPHHEKPVQPTVEVKVNNITDSSLEFGVSTTNATEVRYIFADSSEFAPNVDEILAEGVLVEEDTNGKFVSLLFENLEPSTSYTLHIAAKNSAGTNYNFIDATTDKGEEVLDVAIEITKIEGMSVWFTITSTKAQKVNYMRVPSSLLECGEEVVAQLVESVRVDGTSVEPNTTVEFEEHDLDPLIEHALIAVAEDEDDIVYNYELFNVEMPDSEVATQLLEVGGDYAKINYVTVYVHEVKYVCIEAGSRDVTAEQVMANGVSLEGNVNRDVTIEGLKSDTEYEFYLGYVGYNGVTSMTEALTFTTEKNTNVYTMSQDIAASSYKYSDDNYYITFIDQTNGYILKADFYTLSTEPYLPTGTYALGGMSAGEISKSYTSFMFTPNDEAVTKFDNGSLNVVATPVEETYEVVYTVTGQLYFENGDYVEINYEGTISGISLPQPEVPEDINYEFVVSADTALPKRIHGSGIAAGEYYIKFIDKDWNELYLDIIIDPSLCNNGKDGLLAGVYSTADGTLSTDSYMTLYNPYFSADFVEGELEVSNEGDIYTFNLHATVSSGSETKVVTMTYTGEVEDMVK